MTEFQGNHPCIKDYFSPVQTQMIFSTSQAGGFLGRQHRSLEPTEEKRIRPVSTGVQQDDLITLCIIASNH